MHTRTATFLFLLALVLASCRINTPPQVVRFDASPASGYAPHHVTFYISASDTDGDQLTCTLNFGDGSSSGPLSCGSLLSVPHAYTRAGVHTATLTVDDGRGGRDSGRAQVTVRGASIPESACPAPGTTSLGTQAVQESQPPAGLGVFEGVAYVPGELLVLRSAGVRLQSGQAAALEAQLGLERLDPPQLEGWARYRVPAGEERALARRILESGLGAYVQPNYRYMPLYTPNDDLYDDHQQDQYGLMQITQGWDLLLSGGCRPVVGVIDTGVADDHPDLNAHVVSGYDTSDNDADPYPQAGEYHGTFVASIIAAETNNDRGIAGVTVDFADIMPLKVFPNASSSAIAGAINWAREHGAHVLNMSLCIVNSNHECADLTSNPDATIEAALQTAYNQGVVSLAASGNDNNHWVGYPASSQYTIAVGATNNASPPDRAGFSNYGSDLDVVAPGVHVAGMGIPAAGDPEPYLRGSGTSFATPYTAAVAALYISQRYAKNGSLPTPSQVTSCLRSAAQDLGTAGFDDETGAGLVRADQVLDTVNNSYGCY